MTRSPDIRNLELDCLGQQCPAPVLAVARAAAELAGPGFLTIHADDPAFPADLRAWIRSAGAQLVELDSDQGVHRAVVQIGEPEPEPEPEPAEALPTPAEPESALAIQTFDLRGEKCPTPIVTIAKACARAQAGAQLRIYADDPAFSADLNAWLGTGKAELLEVHEHAGVVEAHLQVTAPAPARQPSATPPPPPEPTTPTGPVRGTLALNRLAPRSPEARGTPEVPRVPEAPEVQVGRALVPREDAELAAEAELPASRRCTLLVLHNDLEALLAALLIANGAASQGMDTNLFFTFWGLNLLRGETPNYGEPDEPIGFMQRMMKWMMPKGPKRQKLGQMHFGGAGRGMLRSIMKRKQIMSLEQLMGTAQELGVEFTACTMSMSVMGIRRRDLHPYPNLDYAGVATFVERARNSAINMTF